MAAFITKIFCAIFLANAVQGKVRCYVCSWHSPTTYDGSTNITDTCSHYNFDPLYSTTIECEKGCEAVSIRKSKNEDIVNFFKNCIPESTRNLEDKCSTVEDNYITTTCTCTSNLCNAAGITRKVSFRWVSGPLLLFMVTFTLLPIYIMD